MIKFQQLYTNKTVWITDISILFSRWNTNKDEWHYVKSVTLTNGLRKSRIYTWYIVDVLRPSRIQTGCITNELQTSIVNGGCIAHAGHLFFIRKAEIKIMALNRFPPFVLWQKKWKDDFKAERTCQMKGTFPKSWKKQKIGLFKYIIWITMFDLHDAQEKKAF